MSKLRQFKIRMNSDIAAQDALTLRGLKGYDERMKSTPDPDTTPSEKMRAFKDGLRQVLTVSKGELAEREKQYLADRADKPKRGPKPRHSSASAHASDNED
jgi:hypothetical protein